MQNRKKQIRTEYLYTALLCIAAVILIVIMIVSNSCESNEQSFEGSAASSAESSVPEQSNAAAESSEEEESSVPAGPVATHTIEISNAEVKNGMLAISGEGMTEPTDLPTIASLKNDLYGLSGNALRLHEDAIEAFNEMIEAFEDAKGENNLIVDKAYTAFQKDNNVQHDLANGNTVMLSIWPVDPDGDYIGGGKFLWLVDNCNDYGYIVRYPSEKSDKTHVGGSGSSRVYRYVGYEHAAYMGKYHLCLEEYLDALRSCTAEAPLQVGYTDASGDEATCEVYFVPASDGDMTELTIRGEEGSRYSVSGNGKDGFIVTCYPEN